MHILTTPDHQIIEYPYSPARLRSDNPGTSFPAAIPAELLAEYSVFPVTQAAKPAAIAGHRVVEADPVRITGVWTQTWAQVPYTANEIAGTRALRIAEIKAERDRRAMASGYAVGANWFHSDLASRIQQIGLVMMGASIPPGLEWKLLGGAKVPMTSALAQQVFGAAAASDAALFATAEAKIAQVTASADPAGIDPLTGWPAGYGE